MIPSIPEASRLYWLNSRYRQFGSALWVMMLIPNTPCGSVRTFALSVVPRSKLAPIISDKAKLRAVTGCASKLIIQEFGELVQIDEYDGKQGKDRNGPIRSGTPDQKAPLLAPIRPWFALAIINQLHRIRQKEGNREEGGRQ